MISETHTPNEGYENFVNAHTKAAAAECIPTKQRAKNKNPWETLANEEKKDNVKTVSLCNKMNPSNAKLQKLKIAQRELINTYQKEQK